MDKKMDGEYCFLTPTKDGGKKVEELSNRDLWEGFKQNTTAHGIPHMGHASGKVKKVFWGILVFACFGALFTHITIIAIQYGRYRVSVNVQITNERELPFPAVTLCNMNPLKKSALTNPGLPADLVNAGSSKKKRSIRIQKQQNIDKHKKHKKSVCELAKLLQLENQNNCVKSKQSENSVSGTEEVFVGNEYGPAYKQTNNMIGKGFGKRSRKKRSAQSCDVDVNVEPISGDCITYYDESNKYHISSGQSLCSSAGFDMAKIDNQRKVDYIIAQDLLSPSSNDKTGIGLQKTGGVFKWTDGDSWVYDNYGKGEPGKGTDCTVIDRSTVNDDWEGVDCTTSHFILCTKHTGVNADRCQTSCIDPADGICYYILHNINKYSHNVGALGCQNNGGRLAVLHSSSKVNLVKTCGALDGLSSDPYHIGLSLSGSWTWSNGDPVVYDNWMAGHPGSGNCGAAQNAGGHGWVGIDCDSAEYIVVCEFQTDQTTLPPAVQTTETTTTEATQQYTTTILTTEQQTTEQEATTILTTKQQTTGQQTTQQQTTADSETTTTNLQTTGVPVWSTTTPPKALPASGSPIEGSSFPERIQNKPEFNKQEKVLSVLSDLPGDLKEKLSQSITEFILDCQYDGHSCFVFQFEHIYNNIHGNCFIFNSGWNSSIPVIQSYRPGRRHGLHLVVNIDQDNYVDLGKEAGARVVISPQGYMPYPEDEGYIVPPGMAASIGITELAVERLGTPYSDCLMKDSTHSRDVFTEHYPVTYNIKGCYKTCYQKYLVQLCNCTDPLVPRSGAAFPIDHLPACNNSDIVQDDCKYNITSLYKENKLDCDCPIACRNQAYSPRTSYAQWPSKLYKNSTLKSLGPEVENLWMDPSEPEKYKDNLLKIEIYFEEFNREFIRDLPAYDLGSFASDLGGVIGLWIGFSVLTLFEFVEFLMDVIVLDCFKSKRERTNNKQNKQLKSIKVKPQQDTHKKRLTPMTLGGAVNVTHGASIGGSRDALYHI